ncbi:MAG: TetR family transcriptional regulator, partial [Sciscionella sp.]
MPVSTKTAQGPTRVVLRQDERRAAARLKLLLAAEECLAELGWSGTSTTEVARRAGLSRGAQQHH